MPQNSIAACCDGIEKAKQALKRKGLSRQKLAGYKDCNLSRSTIDNFFNGKAVSNESFVSICKVLELDFDEIAGISQASKQVSEQLVPLSESLSEARNIDELVKAAHEEIGTYIQCMKLSGQQREELQEALLGTSLIKSLLKQMLSFKLNKKINDIVEGNLQKDFESNLQRIVFILTTTAKSQRWIQDLVSAAKSFNSENYNLENIASKLLTQIFTEIIKIDELVRITRDKTSAYIEERCGTIRVLDMTQPIGLDDIYTNVNILEKITGRGRVSSIEELTKNVSAENFERFSLGGVKEKRIPGLEAVAKYRKLMILGKPGAGKTTFLKHLAYSCIKGKFQKQSIPLFITLKDFAEAPNQPDLFLYLIQFFVKCSVTTNTYTGINSAKQLLKQGKLLVLLDGLDEVREVDSARVLNQIQEFTNDYFKNQFVITCRIAAREYTFGQFTEVEVADFNDEQIESFSKKWFTAKNDIVKATKFFEKLQDDKPIRELATNPLLLTLLCFVFEETASFPKNRSELYKEGLDVLLKKWDVKRNIERDQVYKKLSLKRKEDLLSQVGYSTFKQGQYFFKQKEVEARIIKYIRNLPDCSDDSEALQLDSEAVLKSIEAQHGLFVERARGIYSFSHLTFHEYFTARKIVTNTGDEKLHDLSTHITERRWREVFLLTVGMLDNADSLLQLMKLEIDELLVGDEKLQQYLTWVEEKSNSVEAPYKKAAVRAYYLVLDQNLALGRNLDFSLALGRNLGRNLNLNLALGLARDLDRDLDRDLALDLALDRDLALALDRDLDRYLAPDRDLALALARDRNLAPEGELKRKLEQLKTELPNRKDYGTFKQWWKENGANWTEQLRAIVIEHRNIGHDWQFSESQKELLNKYYGANKLLVECLNSDCYVTNEVRKQIEDTLLLPIKSIPPMS